MCFNILLLYVIYIAKLVKVNLETFKETIIPNPGTAYTNKIMLNSHVKMLESSP